MRTTAPKYRRHVASWISMAKSTRTRRECCAFPSATFWIAMRPDRAHRAGDDLGDRLKAYELAETGRVLDPQLPIYARIDGRSFSTFTRSMRRPFDSRMAAAMI